MPITCNATYLRADGSLVYQSRALKREEFDVEHVHLEREFNENDAPRPRPLQTLVELWGLSVGGDGGGSRGVASGGCGPATPPLPAGL